MGPDARLRGFDGLRAVAILLVIVWHAVVGRAYPATELGVLEPFAMTGWAGVDVFFALSGFLITTLLVREERRGGGSFSVKRFYLRRALRILPVFAVVFLLNVFVFAGRLASVNAREVLDSGSPLGLWPYATFWGNYFVKHASRFGPDVVHPGNAFTVLWSLCVEEHFYLLWPAVLCLVRSTRARVAVAVAVCLAMAAARYAASATAFQSHQAIGQLSHYRLDSILWGALGALVVDRLPHRPVARRFACGAAWALVAILVAAGDLSLIPPPSPLGLSLGLTALAVGTTALLVEIVQAPGSRLAQALEWRPLALVGRLSYAMYLIHFQAMDLVTLTLLPVRPAESLSRFLIAVAAFVVVSIAAAAVLHVAIERPFLRLKERFGRP